MTLQAVSPHDLKPVIPENAVIIHETLAMSVEKFGILNPLLVSEGQVVDGQKRLELALKQNFKEVLVVQTSGLPFILRWQANLNRPWNPVEIALTATNISENVLPEFCASMQMPLSPHLRRSFKFITDTPDLWNDFKENRLSLTILRDLAHLGEEMERFTRLLLSLETTMAEKRVLAGLLKQCSKRGNIPGIFDSDEFDKIRDQLENICQPRRTAAVRKFSQTISEIEFPPGTKVEIDQSFEHPGVVLHVSIKRNHLYKLSSIEKSLDKLFSRMDIL